MLGVGQLQGCIVSGQGLVSPRQRAGLARLGAVLLQENCLTLCSRQHSATAQGVGAPSDGSRIKLILIQMCERFNLLIKRLIEFTF